ncbi:MAG: hypothetical protein AAGK04_06545 [Planctomycetota bacterium]
MPGKPIVIIHGWSDHSGNFELLAQHLSERLGRPVSMLRLADWLSLDDEVTYDDLVDELDREWAAHGLPRRGRKTDVVLHSTGALLVRQWMVERCDATSPPIHRLLMLAPANFGSALAHHGASVAGRAKIGFQSAIGKKKGDVRRAFEPGERLLDGLELASSHTWDLAMRDRFDDSARFYEPGRVLCTTLSGNEGNVLLAAEFDGSDGVVRTAAANLECDHARVDFTAPPDRPGGPRFGKGPIPRKDLPLRRVGSSGRTAFRVINGFRHGDVVLNDRTLDDRVRGEGPRELRVSQLDLLELMAKALSVTDARFDAWANACDRATAELTRELDTHRDDEVHGHLNLVVRVRNQYDQPVRDYFLEIWDDDELNKDGSFKKGRRGRDTSLTRRFQRDVLDDVHAYGGDPSMRCFHIDCAVFRRELKPRLKHGLSMSLTATPMLDRRAWKPGGGPRKGHTRDGFEQVGYYTLEPEDIDRVLIPNEQLDDVFGAHRTLLLDLRLERCQMPDVVRIS